MTYLVETAPDEKRGYSGSWANTGSIVGMLMGAGIAALVTTYFSESTVNDWAWRVPFLLGGIIGGIAIFLRRRLPESEHFKKHHRGRCETSPLLQAFTTDRMKMVKAILFASAYGVLF